MRPRIVRPCLQVLTPQGPAQETVDEGMHVMVANTTQSHPASPSCRLKCLQTRLQVRTWHCKQLMMTCRLCCRHWKK